MFGIITRRRLAATLALPIIAGMTWASGAAAASIGWNADGGSAPGAADDSLLSTDVVGAGVFAHDNWNNHQMSGQGPGATPLALVDDSGAASGVSITGWTIVGGPEVANGWGYGVPGGSSANAKMHNSYTNGGNGDVTTLTYSGLNGFAPLGYSVVVYYGSSGGTAKTGDVTVNGTSVDVTATENFLTAGWVLRVDDTTPSNYAVFTGQTSDTLTVATGTNNFGVTGLSIVAVPEPGSIALLGLGGLLIARRRRG